MGNQHSTGPHRTRKNVHWRSAEPPQPPGRPSAICGEGPDGFEGRLRWLPPMYDGGAPIQGYMVECNRVGSPLWVRTNPPLVLRPELILAGLESGYQYKFRVCAQNAAGVSVPSENSNVLHVSADRTGLVPPKFQLCIADTESMENEKTEFKVYFDGNPVPSVSWFKDGFEIFSSRRTAILNEDNCSTLIFHQTSLSDEGEIKCTITNRAGHAVSRAQLHLQAAPRIRLPRRYEDGLLFDAGETLLLKVVVAGKPNPEIEWRHDGQIIENNDRIQITNGDKFSAVRIVNASRDDRGEYQINARNVVGEDLTSFLVTITAKPDPPKNLKAVRDDDKTAILTWEAPDDDGGCQIGNYIVEYYRTGWNVWLKATTERKLTATLGSLIEGSEYKFRVKAENPYGVSEPSTETESIFIPGKSSSNNFLAEMDIEKTETDEDAPHLVPRRKRLPSPKDDDYDKLYDDDNYNESVPLRKYRNIESIDRDDKIVSNDTQTKKNDKMRYGSSEFMLILYPEGEKSDAEKRKSFQLDLEDAMSPPALSLSAPQLGSNLCLMQPLRNSVSSTELIHEHAMNRVYQVMALKEAQKAKVKKDFITNDTESAPDMRESVAEKNGIVEKVSPKESITEYKEDNESFTMKEKHEISETILPENDEKIDINLSNDSLNIDKSENNSIFEDDYTASTVSTGDSEYSDSDSLGDGRIRDDFDEDKTYHPRAMIPQGIPKEQNHAVKMIPKPVPLPDPNFIPKPILKKREPKPSQSPAKEVKPQKSNFINKVPLLKKITKSPLEKLVKSDKKNKILKANTEANAVSKKVSLTVDKETEKDKSPEIYDGGHLMAERYGNMIKEFSNTKKQPILYDNVEDLKKAAIQQKAEEKTEIENKTPDRTSKQTKPKPAKSVKPSPATKQPIKSAPAKHNKPVKSVNKTTESNNVKDKTSAEYSPSVQIATLPKNFSQLNAEAESNVRNAFSYIINIFMVFVACWLYLFKSEFLALPFLALAIYREVRESFKMPEWITKKISSPPK